MSAYGTGFAFRSLSYSVVSWCVIFSATSALAPRNFAPLLSWVVDQITSPSLLTRRTVASASCLRSLILVESCSPAPRVRERLWPFPGLSELGPRCRYRAGQLA